MVAMDKSPEMFKEAGVKAFVAVQPIDVEIFYRNFGVPGWLVNRMKSVYRDKAWIWLIRTLSSMRKTFFCPRFSCKTSTIPGLI
jgi:hypothetical protein